MSAMWTCPRCGREFKRTNQDHYCGKAPATIDEYIARQEPGLQPQLVQLRDAIRAAIPAAEETISWSMPTWKKKKSNIIHFAVSKNFVSIYAGQEAVEHFSEALNGYETEKGTIRIKHKQEIPFALIAELAKWGYEAENV